MTLKHTFPVVVIVFLLSGCAMFEQTSVEEKPEFDYPGPDTEIEAMLNSYKGKYHETVGRKIATVHDTLRFEKPEGALNNYVADALRFTAADKLEKFVHAGIIGTSSFGVFFEPGDLRVQDVLEFMPYDNHLVILTLTGDQLISLVNQVAEIGGAPISGIRFTIDDQNRARGILVNSEVVDPSREYLVATTSWAANGGDSFSALWNPVDRTNLSIGLKELFIEYFSTQTDLYDSIDSRIRS